MNKKMKTKTLSAILLCICVFVLTACGDNTLNNNNGSSGKGTGSKKSKDELVTSISVEKNGKIHSKIIEEFGEDYYDVAGLKAMIEESIAEYAKQPQSGEVSLKKCETAGTSVTVEMEFEDYHAYAEFNGENFFAGTIQGANEAGFNLDMTLQSVSSKGDGTDTISKPGLLSMGEKHIVILELTGHEDEVQPLAEPQEVQNEGENQESQADDPDQTQQAVEAMRINCFGDILYISDGVSTVSKKSADINLKNGLSVIVFK